MSKQSARKKTVLALAVLISGTGGVAAAQEAPAAAPAVQEATPPAPAAAQPATPVPQPIEATPEAQPAAPAAQPQAKPAPKPALKPAPKAPPPAAEEPPPEEYIEEIVVTGSRIPRKELTTAAPVTVLDKAQLEKTGKTSIGEILQSLPEQSNAINTQYNNGGDGATRVNLRGLGTGRTLVLLNGRRHVAGGTGADATVDLNSIPTAAIQRIEILKDGGSAVYGSDAIAGVVNIITRKDYSGTELRAFSGLSSHGDGLLYDLSLTTGQSTERGNILFTAGYYTQKDVFAGDRQFSKYDTFYDFASRQISTEGSSSTPMGVFLTRGATGGNGAWDALTARYPDASVFTIDRRTGEFRPFNTIGVEDAGGDYFNYQPDNYLVTPQERAHLYTTGGLRLGAGTRAFYEASYTNRQSKQKLASEPLFTSTEGLTVSAGNVYNPFGRDFVDVRRRLNEFGTRDYAQDLTTFRVVTGLEGKLDQDFGALQDWHWDVAYNYGRTQGVTTKQGTLRLSRLAAALGPSFMNASGKAVCGTPEAPIDPDACVPLNLFGGEGTISKEMADYLSFRGTTRGFTQQTSLSANFAGELFKVTPTAHSSGLALGYEHRREGGSYIPDPLTAAGDTTGTKENSTEGRFYVNEAYAELSVPLFGEINPETNELRDIVEVTGAARVFSYNTFGSDFTYKFGTRVSPIPDFTLRATYSTAFRAPSVNELYLGQTDGFPEVVDPCSDRESGTGVDAVCNAQAVPEDFSDDRSQQRTRLGGNVNLKPETAEIFTVGAVFEPRFAKDVTATVDYYLINVDNAITNLTADVILNSCYSAGGPASSQYCERITRDTDGYIVDISDPLTNVGGDKTGGLDFSIRYSPQTPFGRVGVSADATWLQKFDRTLANGDVIKAKGNYDLDGVYTNWRANVGLNWARDSLAAAVNMRFINGFKECEFNSCQFDESDPNAVQPISRMVQDYYTFDANVSYDLELKSGTAGAQFGVNNLFNTKPVLVANGFLASSDASTYDYMGRYFYLRLTYNYY
ncbi:TonB-dependent receptor domain-containing protein [Hyalangium minutum]|uniref:TonB-dependent receptor domain-containing protein n=1 Tax=Hyalangium minutum TaxID=394096 RepID=UPI0004E6A9CD|nr:TonB-dependent receptor [Hyalangium minutum]